MLQLVHGAGHLGVGLHVGDEESLLEEPLALASVLVASLLVAGARAVESEDRAEIGWHVEGDIELKKNRQWLLS